jgi:hypothetical protein
MNKNIIQLSAEKTTQLKALWIENKAKINHKDWVVVNMKLGISQAVFTQPQLFKLTVALAEAGLDPVPEWMVLAINPR